MNTPRETETHDYWIKNLPSSVQEVVRGCNAPLCIVHQEYFKPLVESGVFKYQIWLPDEDICECYRKKAVQAYLFLKNGTAPKWITRQKTIKNKSKHRNYFFTWEMLNRQKTIIGTYAKGINPDIPLDKVEDKVEKYCAGGLIDDN